MMTRTCYFLKEIAKTLSITFFSLSLSYVLIDYSLKANLFHKAGASIGNLCVFYSSQLSNHADTLLPIALLIATIKVLVTAATRNELVALATGCISFKQLANPSLLMGILSTVLLYLNFQFWQPTASQNIIAFKTKVLNGENSEKSLGFVRLQDQTLLIYQTFDKKTKTFFDAYQYGHPNLIFQAAELNIAGDIPIGTSVRILRINDGQIQSSQSIPKKFLSSIQINKEALFDTKAPPRSQTFVQLFKQLPPISLKKTFSPQEAELFTFFLYKMLMPLICLPIAFAPVPFCLKFKRNINSISIYALAMSALLSFFAMINSCLILATHQAFSPLLTMTLPFLCIFVFFSRKYSQL